ncbi:hypothetical protein [uncultured Acetatifactor sp.]|uniref:hypothetical protein n=1 Tax=uncultured Acetatifactor sp. TaxID=1671927 RepID=UPI00261EEF4E|nr:hypothetical protein [uncultured Acetatifactor sp.]
MVTVREACESECPGMHTPLFTEMELGRAEAIASALDGLDVYSAQRLLNKMMTYLLLAPFRATTD